MNTEMEQPIENVDYPFFVATPKKAGATGWKVLCLLLALALAGAVYLLATGFTLNPPKPTDDPILDGGESLEDSAILALEQEKLVLMAEVEKLTAQNNSQAEQIIELLNQCTDLSMKLEMANNSTLSDEEISEISTAVKCYELLIQANVALLQHDWISAEKYVRELSNYENEMNPLTKNAYFVLMENLDRN